MAILGIVVGLLISATPVAATEPPEAPPGSGGNSLPDDWTGMITLEWESGIPDDSPLHQQIEQVSMRYGKRWNLYLTLHAENRGPIRVRYKCTRAPVDYLETSATVGKNGAISTKEIWKIEAGKRILDDHQCNLVLVVDSNTKKHWSEVGSSRFPTPPRPDRSSSRSLTRTAHERSPTLSTRKPMSSSGFASRTGTPKTDR